MDLGGKIPGEMAAINNLAGNPMDEAYWATVMELKWDDLATEHISAMQ